MNKDPLMLLGASAEGYIKSHLSEKLDRDTICRALSTNRTTLSRALILRTGRTFKRYVLDERIKLSKKLLLSGERNVGAIAETCGFMNASYFSRIFCEYTGMTPAKFAASSLDRDNAVWHYPLDAETLPTIPCVHDCAISRIEADTEYLSIFFDDEPSQIESVSRIRPGAKALIIRYHLCDPLIFVYHQFRKKREDGQGYEIGYLEYDSKEEFLNAATDMKLLYLSHYLGYNAVMLKLWAHDAPHEVWLDFNADAVEYRWDFEGAHSNLIYKMKQNGIEFEAGMCDEEFKAAQCFFAFTFPKEIKTFLRQGVPVGDDFFDYRNLSDENHEKFNAFRKRVESGFSVDMKNAPYFLRAMENRYGTSGFEQTLDAVMNEYEKSPKLIPFHGLQCFFDGLDDMPILSYSTPRHLIMCGENFEGYLNKEFCGEKMTLTEQSMQTLMKDTGIWETCVCMEPQISAHVHSQRNKKELMHSKKCGCFYCLQTFEPEEIKLWIDDSETALCPFCQIDSVIGDASGYSITKEFLKTMEAYWFSPIQDKF